MDREPKLPTPMIDAARRSPRRSWTRPSSRRPQTKVGATAMLNTLIAKLAPALAEKMAAKQAGRQQYDEPPRDPEGTLDKPGEDGQVSGRKRGTGGARNGARPHAR